MLCRGRAHIKCMSSVRSPNVSEPVKWDGPRTILRFSPARSSSREPEKAMDHGRGRQRGLACPGDGGSLIVALFLLSACGAGDSPNGDGNPPVATRDASADVNTPSASDGQPNESAPGPPPSGLAFPATFVFGSAIAGFQVDMGCPTLDHAACDDPNSDWYVFTTASETASDPNAHLSGQDPASSAPDSGSSMPTTSSAPRGDAPPGPAFEP